MSHFDLEGAGFATRAIHAGQGPDPAYGALAVPIYQTSTFCFEDMDDGIQKFDGRREGYVYSRGGNPTVRTLELKIAALERGEDCVVTGSGMGAVGSAMIGLLNAGDHVVAGDCLYGCSNVVVREVLPKLGIDVTTVDTHDLAAVEAAITERTRMVYFESATNPLMRLTDVAAVKALCEGRDIKVVVDNTFAPPPVQTPLSLGADIVVHSMTKYLNGHGDVIAGAIVGPAEDIASIRGYAVTKACGCILSPFDAFLVIRGLQTLDLRVRRHCESALALARHLEENPLVARVLYPGLESSPDHELAKRQMNGLFTGILSFELKDGIGGRSPFEAARDLVDAMGLAHIAVSLGDPASLVQQPYNMTHHNVCAEEKEAMGIGPGLIRYSVGLEDVDDIIADFDQAFEALKGE